MSKTQHSRPLIKLLFLCTLTSPFLLAGCQLEALLKPQNQSGSQTNASPQQASTATSTATSTTNSSASTSESIIVDNRQALATLEETGYTYWNLRRTEEPSAFMEPGSIVPTPWIGNSLIDTNAESQALSYYNLVSRLDSLDPLLVSGSARLRLNTLKQLISQHSLALDCQVQANPLITEANAYDKILETLANEQPIGSIDQAHAYIEQLALAEPYLKQWQQRIEASIASGVAITGNSKVHALQTLQQELARAPFSKNEQSSMIWLDFQQKLSELGLYPKSQAILEKEAEDVLNDQLRPIIENIIVLIDTQIDNLADILPVNPEGQHCLVQTLNQWSATEGYRSKEWVNPAGERLDALAQRLTDLLQFNGSASFAAHLKAWKLRHGPEAITDEQVVTQLKKVSEQLPNYFTELPTASLSVIKQSPEDLLTGENTQGFSYALTGDEKNGFTGLLTLPSEAAAWPSSLYINSLPGLHLQQAMAAEQQTLPSWLHMPELHNFSPAWPIYAAELAAQMTDIKAYENANQAAWLLVTRMEAELDLFLDTGLHSGELNATEALKACMDYSGDSEAACTERLTNISNQPGQASRLALELDAFDRMLASLGATYSAEELKLQRKQTRLQQAAQSQKESKEQGSDKAAPSMNEPLAIEFSTSPVLKTSTSVSAAKLAAFHSAFLKQGALPAPVFQQWLTFWLAEPEVNPYQRQSTPSNQ